MNHLPKIELHCHLDGSVRPSTVADIAQTEKINLPTLDIEKIENFMMANSECDSLEEVITRFQMPITIMQSSSSLQRVAYELLEDAAKENVKYIEVRFAPHFHTAKGLSMKSVIENVLKGMKRAEMDFEIKGNLILSCLRSYPTDLIYSLVEVGKEFIGRGVVGIDLCEVENEGFSEEYVLPLKKAKENGFRITVHAGETGSGHNVLEAIRMLGAERIGHGVQLSTDQEAYNLVKETGTVLEMCPTSNLETKIIDSYESHPIMNYIRDGIRVSVSTDNRTAYSTSMNKELEILKSTFGMTDEEYKAIYLNSIDASFADDETKKWLETFVDAI